MKWIYGFGASGRAVFKRLKEKGEPFYVIDRHPQELAEWISEEQALTLEPPSELILSPGVALTDLFRSKLLAANTKIKSEIEFALTEYPTAQRIIGVTGSNGKSTTVLLIAALLKGAGLEAIPCGNLGEPLTSALLAAPKNATLVLELSSFQLEETRRPFLSEAVCLNVTPNHLDRHKTIECYMAAKEQIFDLLLPNGRGFAPKGLFSHRQLLPIEEGDFEAFLEKERGRWRFHDRAQLSIAWQLTRDLLSRQTFEEVAQSFLMPPHRLTHAFSQNGIDFIDDSKATTPEASLFALSELSRFKRPILLLLGGVDKESSFDILAKKMPKEVKKVFVFGRSRAKIEKALKGYPLTSVASMEEALCLAKKEASFGDLVLLSPGCASFDAFSNYRERGLKFQELCL